jgi:hypothetical protein
MSEGELGVFENVKRKAKDAAIMFERMIELMNNELSIEKIKHENKKITLPAWL